MSINTHQLEVFLAASETLNYTQAAQKLQISQPSVSQHIQALEEHFGLELFARIGRSMDLTDAGKALVPLAKELVFLTAHIDETMSSFKEGVRGHLKLGCGTATGRYIIPRVLACFNQICPEVHTTCYPGSQAEALEMLVEGKVQLAFTGSIEPIQDVEFIKLAEERVRLITPARHPWADRQEITPEELGGINIILPSITSDIYETLSQGLAKVGLAIKDLPSQLTMGNLESIALSVQEGLGAGFVPDLVIDQLAPGSVHVVDIRDLEMGTEFFLARHQRRPQTAAQVEFTALIQEIDLSQLRCGKYAPLAISETSGTQVSG